jgi:hypothetical protein
MVVETRGLLRILLALFFCSIGILCLFAKDGADKATANQRKRIKHNFFGRYLNPYAWEFKADGSPRRFTRIVYFLFFMALGLFIAFGQIFYST